jgi:hypothetical protein
LSTRIAGGGLSLVLALALLVGTPRAEECRTHPDLEARLLETSARRSATLPPLAPPLALEATESTRLDDILGPDGYLERGAIIDVGNVTVFVDDGSNVFGTFVSGFQLDIVRASRAYYGVFPDDIDNLTFLPNFDHIGGTFHALIRNDVEGINRPQVDETAVYGSPGRLQSILLFSNFTHRPDDPYQRVTNDNNTSLSLMAHEFAHRFGAFPRFWDSQLVPPGPSYDLLGRGHAHWCFFHDTRSAFAFAATAPPGMSVLEGNLWDLNMVNGDYRTAGVTDGYSPLDLYLMGLMEPEEVPPFFYLKDPQATDGGEYASCITSPVSTGHQGSRTFAGTLREVTIEDVIAVEGPRVPGVADSQKNFRQTLVLVTRNGRFPSPAEVAKIDALRVAWEDYFSAATGGRASVDTTRPTGPGPAVTFAFVRLPDAVQAGRETPFALLALDADGRVATGYEGTVAFASSDPDAVLPPPVTFDAGHRGYRTVDTPVVFSTGGSLSLTATDMGDSAVTGTRSNIAVEGPVIRVCVPAEPDPTDNSTKPWGVGATWSGSGGVRFQYLLRAETLGRPAMIQDVDWAVAGGPDGVQWETLFIKMGNKPVYQLLTQAGNPDLDRNLMDSYDLMTVLSGHQEQRGLQDSGRVHMRLVPMFPYDGINHLLIEARYSGGGPPGLEIDLVPVQGSMLHVERLGPNFPVPVDQASTICLGLRPSSGVFPVISDLGIGELKNQTVEISWRTSPETDGRILYGPVGAGTTQVSMVDRFSFAHTILLEGLTPDTTYEAVVVSQDYDAQESRSQPFQFTTTADRPVVTSLHPPALSAGTPNSAVRVLGDHFFHGLQVEIVDPDLSGPDPPPPDPHIQVVAFSRVNDTILDIGVSVAADAPLGPRRIHVVNTDGFEVYSDVFFGVLPPRSATDVDGTGRVDGFDLARLSRAFGATYPNPRYDALVDLDGDGDVDGMDLTRLANSFGTTFTP